MPNPAIREHELGQSISKLVDEKYLLRSALQNLHDYFAGKMLDKDGRDLMRDARNALNKTKFEH